MLQILGAKECVQINVSLHGAIFVVKWYFTLLPQLFIITQRIFSIFFSSQFCFHFFFLDGDII